jgi:hypothetical protein
MPLDNTNQDDVMPPFDERYDSYDPIDLTVIQNQGQAIFQQDAVEFGGSSLFFARQLDYVKATVYARKFPTLNADLLVPDDTSTPEWAETVTVMSYDSVGMAKIISNYADDLPRADVRAMAQMITVKTLGDSYGYNISEIRASRAIGAGLDVRKADAARRAIDLKIAKIKLVGDPDYGLFGLFTHPNIPEILLPFGGPWDLLTGDQIYENLNAMVFAYNQQTLGTHNANFLALAPNAYHSAATKFFNAPVTTPITALALFQSMNPGITVKNVIECRGAEPGTPNKDVALLYELTSDNIAHNFVMPFSQLPPEARNLEFVTNCLAKSGGVNIYYPLSLLKAITS